jgi:hypothetical protein
MHMTDGRTDGRALLSAHTLNAVCIHNTNALRITAFMDVAHILAF